MQKSIQNWLTMFNAMDGWIEILSISKTHRHTHTLTKSLCKSLLRNGDIFTAPINMKNNPNRIDRLLSTTDELTLFWLSGPAGGGWAFCVFCDGGDGVIVVVYSILNRFNHNCFILFYKQIVLNFWILMAV